jgi:hypothetical protein
MWRRLEYFSVNTFTERLGNAFRMLQDKRDSDEIFAKNFVSAEGWYSQLVFHANMSVKIIGRGFDDFYRHPVVVYKGRLSRCDLNGNLTGCVSEAVHGDVPTTAHTLPKMQVRLSTTVTNHSLTILLSLPAQLVPSQAAYEPTQCKMFWLPVPTRYWYLCRVPHRSHTAHAECMRIPCGEYSIVTSVYEKKAVLQKDRQARVKLQRVGESVFEQGQWYINDEEVRQQSILVCAYSSTEYDGCRTWRACAGCEAANARARGVLSLPALG